MQSCRTPPSEVTTAQGCWLFLPRRQPGPVPQGCGRRKERQGQGGCFHKVPLCPREAPLQGPTQARSSGFPGLAPGERDSCGAALPLLLMPFASSPTPSVFLSQPYANRIELQLGKSCGTLLIRKTRERQREREGDRQRQRETTDLQISAPSGLEVTTGCTLLGGQPSMLCHTGLHLSLHLFPLVQDREQIASKKQ